MQTNGVEQWLTENVERVVDVVVAVVVGAFLAVVLLGCGTPSELKYSNPAVPLEFSLSSDQTGELQGSLRTTTTKKKAVGSDANGNVIVPGGS